MKRKNVKLEERRRARGPGTFHVSRFTPAFTLLEMLVTLALMALLATVVTISLAGPRRAAHAQDAADELLNYDRLTREWCRRFGIQGGMVFDLDRATVRRMTPEGRHRDSGAGAQPATLRLAGGFRVARVVSRGGSHTAGEVVLPCSTRGQTPSYAVLLSGPGGQQWLVVAGLTGKAVLAGDEREVEAIFMALSGGDDAR